MINPISFGTRSNNNYSAPKSNGSNAFDINFDDIFEESGLGSNARTSQRVGKNLDYYDSEPSRPRKKRGSKPIVPVAITLSVLIAALGCLSAIRNQSAAYPPASGIVEDFEGEIPGETALKDLLNEDYEIAAPENNAAETTHADATEETPQATQAVGDKTPKEAKMTASNDCKEVIKNAEGYHSDAYKCPSGKNTIGWGHTKGVKPGDKITVDKAEKYLQEDIDECIKYIYANVKVPLTQGQFDALVSFVFNCGAGNFEDSTLLELLNEGNYEGAANEFPRWVYGTDPDTGEKVKLGGLVIRRAAEQALFLS